MNVSPLSSPTVRTLRTVWRDAFAAPRFAALAVSALPALVLVLFVLRHFLDRIEARAGVVLTDPVLAWIPPRDVANMVFGVMYPTLLMGFWVLARHPRRLVTGLWAYVALMSARMGVMYLLPLDPPLGLVPLRDPFVELFGGGRVLTRDLFFSGHTATLCLYALVLPPGWSRKVALAAMAIVATGVLIHHAHYTVDVVSAPFFALSTYVLVKRGIDRLAPVATPKG